MQLNIQNCKLDPRLWLQGTWSLEGRGEALERVPGFAREFFAKLDHDYPELQSETVFLRCTTQPEDLFSVVDRIPGGVLIQIDPALGYIIVHDDAGHGEYGDWGNGFDRVEEALKHVRISLKR